MYAHTFLAACSYDVPIWKFHGLYEDFVYRAACYFLSRLSQRYSRLVPTHTHSMLHTHMQSFLAIEDIGDSLDSVEALITKHKNFEKSLVAQEEKFKVRIYYS